MATVVARRGSRGLFGITAATLVLLVLAGAVAVVGSSPSGREVSVRTAEIDEGVSLHRVGDRSVIFVRSGDTLTAYAQVDARGDRVIWCPGAQRFATIRDGSMFTVDGRKLGGPSPADLVELSTRQSDGVVHVSTSRRWGDPIAAWSDMLPGQWTSARGTACPPPG
jgi:hypothetical protein